MGQVAMFELYTRPFAHNAADERRTEASNT